MARKQTHDWDDLNKVSKQDPLEENEIKVSLAEKVMQCLRKVWQWICELFM